MELTRSICAKFIVVSLRLIGGLDSDTTSTGGGLLLI